MSTPMIETLSPPILTTEQLVESIARNAWVIGQQVAGLTHADSLRQPESRGNCLNWVLGHILVHRDRMLKTAGEEPMLDAATIDRYKAGSAPVLGEDEGVLPLVTLLERLSQAQERLAAMLTRLTEADLARVSPLSESATVAQHIAFLAWHETYHIGQLEYLRQLAGTNDQVI